MPDQRKEFNSCPFCGGDASDAEEGRLRLTATSNGYFAVICLCGAAGPIRDSEKVAIEAWNTRDYPDRHLANYPFIVSPNATPLGLRGNLKSLSFPIILQILSSEKKTGALFFKHEEKTRAIYFKDGKIVAASGKEGLRLGQIGRGEGLISQEQLQEALEDARKSGKRVGEVLLLLDYITEDGLKRLIRHQIRETVLEISLWQEGDFEYRDYPIEFDERGIADINIMRIILETAMRKDERTAA
jgi:Lar family restriction alleviation protein